MNFLNTVAQTTGATVNASSGYVGSSKLGGSWDLNVSARPVPPFAAAALEAFEGVLAAPVVTQGQLSVTYAGELQALRIGDVITLTFIADANDTPVDLAVEFDVSGLTGQTPPVLLTADPVDGSPGVFSLDFTVPEDGLSFDSARVGVVVTNNDGSTALTLSESLLVDSVRPSIVSIERDGGEYVTDAGGASFDLWLPSTSQWAGLPQNCSLTNMGMGRPNLSNQLCPSQNRAAPLSESQSIKQFQTGTLVP